MGATFYKLGEKALGSSFISTSASNEMRKFRQMVFSAIDD